MEPHRSIETIPHLFADPKVGLVNYESFKNTYHNFQAVFLPCCKRESQSNLDASSNYVKNEASSEKRFSSIRSTISEETAKTCDDVWQIFSSLVQDEKDTWCVENAGEIDSMSAFKGTKNKSINPYYFLRSHKRKLRKRPKRRGYCSFIVQNEVSMKNLIERLPTVELPISPNTLKGESDAVGSMKMRHGPCIWFFFGRNDGKDLTGRPEHTDSVSHDGTWHYQMSGKKVWHLRPTEELLRMAKEEGCQELLQLEKGSGGKGVMLECVAGDVLVVNTRLWWHHTVIPQQKACGEVESVPSVSYARDFYILPNLAREKLQKGHKEIMTNIDGIYAPRDIEQNTSIFTEEEMPDGEMHRSADPNCEVIIMETGLGAIVAKRFIKAGEFLSVVDSDEDDMTGDDEEMDYDEMTDDEMSDED